MEVKKYFTVGEEISHSIVHGIGALLSIAALVLLVVKADTPIEDISVAIFASAAIILYLMSCLYHAFGKGITKDIFERFDHISIFILIAATYTPFCLISIGGTKGWVLFSIQWGLVLFGIVFKSIWIHKYVLLSTLIYLLMGWSVIFFFQDLVSGLQPIGFYYLILGGIAYSVGVIFYIFPLFKFHHTVWHLFVIIGTFLHFLCIYSYLL